MAETFTYKAIKIQQRPSAPPFYLLGAPAKEITRWADAPHKKSSLRAGYQRELDEARLGSIEKFLELSGDNILPSAALIAVRPSAFSAAEDMGSTYRW